MSRIFLLSPAHCGGKRAKQVLSPKAAFPLAEQLRSKEGARLGDIFSFVSVGDEKALSDVVITKIHTIDGVEETDTHIVAET